MSRFITNYNEQLCLARKLQSLKARDACSNCLLRGTTHQLPPLRHMMSLARVGLSSTLRQGNLNPSPAEYLTVGLLPKPSTHRSISRAASLEEHTDAGRKLPQLRVAPSDGRGLGLFAVDRIPAYAKVIEDDALISLARGEDLPQLWERYQLLPAELRQQYDRLSYSTHLASQEETQRLKLVQRGYDDEAAQEMVRVSSRFQANAFKTGNSNGTNSGNPTRKVWAYVLFLNVARINHSCTPNAHVHHRPSSGVQIGYALREIEPGEEIELSYFDITMATADRQARARSWGFSCKCPACTGSGMLKDRPYEQDLSFIHRHVSVDKVMGRSAGEVDKVVADIRAAIDLASSSEYSWLATALPNLYLNLELVLHRAQKPRTELVDALMTSLEWESRLTGPDSPASEGKRDLLLHLGGN